MVAPYNNTLMPTVRLFSYYYRGTNISSCFKLNEIYQVRHYAARKGTREKARKKKVKVEEKKVGFIPHILRGKNRLKLPTTSKRLEDHWKSVSTDDVWIARYYKWRVYSFAEAVECHRETHHPTIYNVPDASLNAFIELDMTAAKKTRYVDKFTRMVSLPHHFNHGEERSILAFCKTSELQKEALGAGATLAGASELIKDIQSGELSLQDFQYIVSHPNMLPELVPVRGLMKNRFPNPRNGTLGPDIADVVSKFRHGIKYSVSKDDYEQDYGCINTSIGMLDMDVSHLEANLRVLLQDIESVRPKREGLFITRLLLLSAPSVERLKVEVGPYLQKSTGNQLEANDDDDEEEERGEEAATIAR